MAIYSFILLCMTSHLAHFLFPCCDLVDGVDPIRREKLIELLDIDLQWRMHKVSDGQRRRVQICMGLLHPYKVNLVPCLLLTCLSMSMCEKWVWKFALMYYWLCRCHIYYNIYYNYNISKCIHCNAMFIFLLVPFLFSRFVYKWVWIQWTPNPLNQIKILIWLTRRFRLCEPWCASVHATLFFRAPVVINTRQIPNFPLLSSRVNVVVSTYSFIKMMWSIEYCFCTGSFARWGYSWPRCCCKNGFTRFF